MLTAVLYHTLYVPLIMRKEWKSEITGLFWKDGKFNKLAFIALILRAINCYILPIALTLLTYFSVKVGLIPAVVQSSTTFTSFLTAFIFYFMYGEKLTPSHLTGMVLIVSGVILVAVAKSFSHNDI